MPAVSEAQRRAMAIALHNPSKLFGRNRSLLKMSKSDLHDFASTKESGMPHKKEKKKHDPRPALKVRKRR